MASTNKTANLGLNQWVESDPFLREDANADNSRIDAETKRLQAQLDALPYVKLMDITTAANAQQVDLDVSGIDFTKFTKIELIYSLTARREDSYYETLLLKLNNAGGMLYTGDGSSLPVSQTNLGEFNSGNSAAPPYRRQKNSFHTVLCGFFSPNDTDAETISVENFCASNKGGFHISYYSSNLRKLNTINFLTSDNTTKIDKGSRIVMYGVKL